MVRTHSSGITVFLRLQQDFFEDYVRAVYPLFKNARQTGQINAVDDFD